MSDELLTGKIGVELVNPYIGRLKAITDYKRKRILVAGIDLSGPGYFEGQSFEKNESTKYNSVKYKLIHSNTGKIVDEYISIDGAFKFIDLNVKEFYSIIVTDINNKYIGKFIERLNPEIDYNDAIQIIRIYQTQTDAQIKVKYNGDSTKVSVFVQNANIEKIDDTNYKISEISGPYTVTLHDYIDNVLYTKESTFT